MATVSTTLFSFLLATATISKRPHQNNSPYCLPYSSGDVGLENLVLDQLIFPKFLFFFILITCLLDIVLIL